MSINACQRHFVSGVVVPHFKKQVGIDYPILKKTKISNLIDTGQRWETNVSTFLRSSGNWLSLIFWLTAPGTSRFWGNEFEPRRLENFQSLGSHFGWHSIRAIVRRFSFLRSWLAHAQLKRFHVACSRLIVFRGRKMWRWSIIYRTSIAAMGVR